MKTLLKQVKIFDKQSPYHLQIQDVLLEDGTIAQIASDIVAPDVHTVEGNGLCVSVGWLDMRVHLKDPGYEHKETLRTLCESAERGGFTEIAVLPHTKPVVQTKESIAYIKHFAATKLIDIHAIAAATLNCEGKDFTEILDLHHAGAVAFSDGEHPLWHADILLKILQYLAPINGLLIDRPEDVQLTRFGQMHEGEVSTALGLKGIPAMAEEIAVARNLKLLDYTGLKGELPRLHFSLISTAESVSLIRNAKTQGLPVSGDVSVNHLVFNDSVLMGFDTNFKVNPPLRSQADVEALWQGLADGTIDAIVSDHHPQDAEAKELEFDLAEFGVIGLETAFAALHTEGKIAIETLVEKLAYAPRHILRLSKPCIRLGAKANLTVFSTEDTWTYRPRTGTAQNSPFSGTALKGKVVAVFNNLKYETYT
jgi:dihydroorotase